MISLHQIRVVLFIFVLFGLMLFIGALPTGTLAQGGPLPTPTNVGEGGDDGNGGGGGGSGNGSDSDATPVPPKAMVSGFVYNYSSAAYQGGVAVVIDGGGWQAETVTDSNGYYEIGDLGSGTGVVKMQLPPEAQPVTTNWPVRLSSGAKLRVDLGYYWGDEPPLPVSLSAEQQGNQLVLAIENHTSEAATGGLLQISSPPEIRVLPAVQISQGQVTSYDSHQFEIDVAELLPQDRFIAAVTLTHNIAAAAQASQSSTKVRVTFEYDQQITPQVVEFEMSQASPTETTASSRAAPESSSSDPAAAEFEPPVQNQEPLAASNQAASKPEGISPLPITGSNLPSSGMMKLALALLVVLGLALGGWYSLRARPKNL